MTKNEMIAPKTVRIVLIVIVGCLACYAVNAIVQS